MQVVHLILIVSGSFILLWIIFGLLLATREYSSYLREKKANEPIYDPDATSRFSDDPLYQEYTMAREWDRRISMGKEYRENPDRAERIMKSRSNRDRRYVD